LHDGLQVTTMRAERRGEDAVSKSLVEELLAKGVEIPAPSSVVVEDLDVSRIEAGVVLYPGCVVRGAETLLRAGTRLGRAGGGFFENVRCGERCDLYGGYFEDAVFLADVTMRGHAEVRGGTLLEEGCEAAHHVGYKMTVCLPYVVAGSLINFCDALVSGGTSRSDHSEIGSTLALYNFTPWGDKYASLFGGVARGVFLRERPIFVGGQTQVVSPVRVGFGAVLTAGSAVRRDVPEDRLYGEATTVIDEPFDAVRYGALLPKFEATREYTGNLWALIAWYDRVRIPTAKDALERVLYEAALQQLRAGVAERVKRLGKVASKLEASRLSHEAAAAAGGEAAARHSKRAAEHAAVQAAWPAWEAAMKRPEMPSLAALDSVAASYLAWRGDTGRPLVDFVRKGVADGERLAAVETLVQVVQAVSK
jgi:UDP-N-acetylglucosamine/UDP-N-acetylgalactosamine diphosphorylase